MSEPEVEVSSRPPAQGIGDSGNPTPKRKREGPKAKLRRKVCKLIFNWTSAGTLIGIGGAGFLQLVNEESWFVYIHAALVFGGLLIAIHIYRMTVKTATRLIWGWSVPAALVVFGGSWYLKDLVEQKERAKEAKAKADAEMAAAVQWSNDVRFAGTLGTSVGTAFGNVLATNQGGIQRSKISATRSLMGPQWIQTNSWHVSVGGHVYGANLNGSGRRTNEMGIAFYPAGSQLLFDCMLWVPEAGPIVVRSNRYEEPNPFVVEMNWDEQATEWVNQAGKVVFQFMQEKPYQYRLFGMFAATNGIWTADITGRNFIPYSNRAGKDALTNGLKVRPLFQYPASVYPGLRVPSRLDEK